MKERSLSNAPLVMPTSHTKAHWKNTWHSCIKKNIHLYFDYNILYQISYNCVVSISFTKTSLFQTAISSIFLTIQKGKVSTKWIDYMIWACFRKKVSPKMVPESKIQEIAYSEVFIIRPGHSSVWKKDRTGRLFQTI